MRRIEEAKLKIALDALTDIACLKMIKKGSTSSYGSGYRNFTIKDSRRIANAAINRIDLFERDELANTPSQEPKP